MHERLKGMPKMTAHQGQIFEQKQTNRTPTRRAFFTDVKPNGEPCGYKKAPHRVRPLGSLRPGPPLRQRTVSIPHSPWRLGQASPARPSTGHPGVRPRHRFTHQRMRTPPAAPGGRRPPSRPRRAHMKPSRPSGVEGVVGARSAGGALIWLTRRRGATAAPAGPGTVSPRRGGLP